MKVDAVIILISFTLQRASNLRGHARASSRGVEKLKKKIAEMVSRSVYLLKVDSQVQDIF